MSKLSTKLSDRIETFYTHLQTELEGYSVEQARQDAPKAIQFLQNQYGMSYNPTGSNKLLTSTSKMKKTTEAAGYTVVGLQFQSANRSGFPLCPTALLQGLTCTKNCIDRAGNGRFASVKNARQWRAQLLHDHPRYFMSILIFELEKSLRASTLLGLKLAVRLNVFSDIPWLMVAPWLFPAYPEVQFYDYFKELVMFLFYEIPDNYNLTYSWHEQADWSLCEAMLEKGINVSVVFKTREEDELPSAYQGYPVLNGETHDMRFLDPRGHVIGLKVKGPGRSDKTIQETPFFMELPPCVQAVAA